ncbi:MAG: cell envelope integrity protein CreD [Cryomorphaceae bacterium]
MTDSNPPTPTDPTPSAFDRINHWISSSMSLRLVIIGILILILLIPLGMIQELIRERMYRLEDAKNEVARLWANDQTISGPYVAVPYTNYDMEGNPISEGNLHLLPEDLAIQSNVVPEIRYRGIFEIPVYQSENQLTFVFIARTIPPVPSRKMHWNLARICLGLSDTRGITNTLELTVDGKQLEFNPGIPDNSLFDHGVSAPIALDWSDSSSSAIKGSVKLTLRGSNSLSYIPLGKTTTVAMNSSWPDPSFDGDFLPLKREIDKDGFHSEWKVLHYNRNFPQAFYGTQEVHSSSFGVNLFMPVNHYQKSERSAKYAVLMIALTFILLFFSQAINHIRIHPFQYFLVGLALSLFYTLLLSMSEHLGFNGAYSISAFMVLALVVLYLKRISSSWKYPLITGAVLGGLYIYIFTLLQMEDFALLIGSIGLFIILAVIMWMSTKIDWNGETHKIGEPKG